MFFWHIKTLVTNFGDAGQFSLRLVSPQREAFEKNVMGWWIYEYLELLWDGSH
jgi:hypothetical protein